jgi:hypothetical protein
MESSSDEKSHEENDTTIPLEIRVLKENHDKYHNGLNEFKSYCPHCNPLRQHTSKEFNMFWSWIANRHDALLCSDMARVIFEDITKELIIAEENTIIEKVKELADNIIFKHDSSAKQDPKYPEWITSEIRKELNTNANYYNNTRKSTPSIRGRTQYRSQSHRRTGSGSSTSPRSRPKTEKSNLQKNINTPGLQPPPTTQVQIQPEKEEQLLINLQPTETEDRLGFQIFYNTLTETNPKNKNITMGETDDEYVESSNKKEQKRQRQPEYNFDNDQEVIKSLTKALAKLSTRERNIKPINNFRGTIEEDPHDWIEEYNNAAIANNWNDEAKLQIVRGYLTKGAAEWLKNQEEFDTWEEFEKAFEKKYTTHERQNQWLYEWQNLEQGTMKVSEYANKFNNLLKKIDPEDNFPDKFLITKFIAGLKESIAQRVMYDTEKCDDLETTVKHAKRYERGDNFKKSKPTNNPFLKGWKSTRENKEDKDMDDLINKFKGMEIKLIEARLKEQQLQQQLQQQQFQSLIENKTCFKCGKEGHLANKCKLPPCKTCGKTSHVSKDCYKIRTCEKCGNKGHTKEVCKKKEINTIETIYQLLNAELKEDSGYHTEDESENDDENEYESDNEDNDDESNDIYNLENNLEAYLQTRAKKYTDNKQKKKKYDPMEIDGEQIKVRKYKDPSQIDLIKKYDIVKDIMNLPANITLAQILQMNNEQQKLLKEAMKRKTQQELA